MAKTQATKTRSAVSIAVASMAVYQQALDAIQQLNWSFGRRPHVHVAATTGPAGWISGSVHTLQCIFASSATGYQRRIRTRIKIPADTVNVIVGVRTFFSGTDTGNVRVTVGGANTVFSCATGNNSTEQRATLATASTGTGWQTVLVEQQRLTGSTQAYLYNFRIQDEAITSSLPDPQND